METHPFNQFRHLNAAKVKQLFFVFMMLPMSYCFPQVVLNEIQSSNTSTLVDNYGEYEDWIELYNPNDFEVDIAGLVLKDNVDTWQIPYGDALTAIPPKGYFLLWADDEEPQGKFHTNFKLSAANGEFLGLYQYDSVTLIESVNFPPMADNKSYGKCDQQGWVIFDNPTPKKENDCLNSNTELLSDRCIVVSPTLAKGELTISLPKGISSGIEVNMYSMEGKNVRHLSSEKNTFHMDLVGLTNNMYIITITAGEYRYQSKIVINNN